MKWYKVAHDNLPKENKFVLVSFLYDSMRTEDTCVIARLSENYYGDAVWNDGVNFYQLTDTDRWAYIELPED